MLLGYNKKGGVYQGTVVVPGGGIDKGETELAALGREVREETGIDISGADIESIGESEGSSEKFIKELGETALVEMKFHDYLIRLVKNAEDIAVTSDDDFDAAGWFPLTDLNDLTLGPAVRATLARNDFVSAEDPRKGA